MIKRELNAPCATCPYRRSVRLAFWSPKEYANLEKQDARALGQPFGCHGDAKKPKEERRFCAGWLLDQRRRGTPSLMLRLALFKNPKLAQHYDKLKDLGAALYSSIAEMFETNYPGRRWRRMQPKEKR